MKKYILPLILILLLTFTLIGDCWVAGYDQRIKLTTDHTKIDDTLSNFPVTAFFTATQAEEIFAEFDADEDFDRGQFALGNDTLLYAEKELFDDSESLAIYHFKATSVSSSAGTDIYFYYDNDAGHNTTYIGAIDTVAGGNVWDGNFKGVWHLVDATTSTIKDSTSNNNDGAKKGANEPIEAMGKVGQGQDFDNTDDYIQMGNDASLHIPDTLTVEFLHNPNSDAAVTLNPIYHMGSRYDEAAFEVLSYGTVLAVYLNDHVADAGADCLVIDTWQAIAFTYDKALGSANLKVFRNATQVATDDYTTSLLESSYDLAMGKTGGTYAYNGFSDEVRISSVARSAAWLKATYNSLWDTLLTYGAEEIKINALFFGSNF